MCDRFWTNKVLACGQKRCLKEKSPVSKLQQSKQLFGMKTHTQKEILYRFVLPACSSLQERLDFFGAAAVLTVNGDERRARLRRGFVVCNLVKAKGRKCSRTRFLQHYRPQDNYRWTSYVSRLLSVFPRDHCCCLRCAAQHCFTKKESIAIAFKYSYESSLQNTHCMLLKQCFWLINVFLYFELFLCCFM